MHMARIRENRRSRHEDEREEMSPVGTGLILGSSAVVGLALGLAIRHALSDSEVPFEASQEAIDRVESFENEDGVGFGDYTVRGAGLAVALTAAPWVKIPKDLDPSDLPGDAPKSPEGVIDYLEEYLEVEVSDKRAAKIRKNFAKLEKEWDKKEKEKDDESGSGSDGETAEEEEDDLDEETGEEEETTQ
jgi:hypothetical protein